MPRHNNELDFHDIFVRQLVETFFEKLIPCPRCGGDATVIDSVESWAECQTCGVRTGMVACHSGAVKNWNDGKVATGDEWRELSK